MLQHEILQKIKELLRKAYIKRYWLNKGIITENDRIELIKECSENFFDTVGIVKENGLIKDKADETDKILDIYKVIMNNYIEWEKEFSAEYREGGLVKE